MFNLSVFLMRSLESYTYRCVPNERITLSCNKPFDVILVPYQNSVLFPGDFPSLVDVFSSVTHAEG